MANEELPRWLKYHLNPEEHGGKEVHYKELEDGTVELAWERGIPGERVLAAIDLFTPTPERADNIVRRLVRYGVEKGYMFDHRHVPIGAVKNAEGKYEGGVGVSFGVVTMESLGLTMEDIYGTEPTPDMYRGLLQWSVDNATPLSSKTIVVNPVIDPTPNAFAAEMIWLESEHHGE